jgi:membrane fusion protein (multidrug efflux system)
MVKRGASAAFGAAVLLLAGAVASVPSPAAAQRPPQAVVLAPVAEERISDRIEALGTLQPNESVVLTANVSERIEELLFDEGQTVTAGDLLIVLEQEEERAELDAAEAILAERRAAFDRTSQLRDRDFAARAQLDERRAALREAVADVEIARARLQDRNVLAPFDGRIGFREVSVGTLVEPGDPIATLSDISSLKLTMTVPSRFLDRLRPGLAVQARSTALPNRTFEGAVEVVDTSIDPVTRTLAIRARIPNRGGILRPGLLMTAELLSNPRPAITVPEEALVPLDRRNFVFVVPRDDASGGNAAVETTGETTVEATVERRQIRLGTRTAGTVEVVEGLRPGDRVVVHGTMGLQDGAAVRVLGTVGPETSVEEILRGGGPADAEGRTGSPPGEAARS